MGCIIVLASILIFKKHSEGLIALTSGLNGPIGSTLFMRDSEQLARENIERLADIFGEDHLFLIARFCNS